MAAPTNPADLDDAIRRYLLGESPKQIKAATGVGGSVLSRERTRRGIPAVGRRRAVDAASIVAAYLAGESEYAISQRLGISRPVVQRRLEEASVARRSHSDAGRVRARRMTPEERLAQATPSHDASRGRKVPYEDLVARALVIQERGLCDSPGELQMLGCLRDLGHAPVVHQAIGKYNVDLAVQPVAVEVLGGGWHYAKRHHAVRTPYILDQGWSLLFVWNHEGRSALTPKAAHYVSAYIEEVRRDPSLIGEYRVVSGDGEFLTSGRAEDDKFPLVPPPRGRVDRRA